MSSRATQRCRARLAGYRKFCAFIGVPESDDGMALWTVAWNSGQKYERSLRSNEPAIDYENTVRPEWTKVSTPLTRGESL